MCTLKRERCVPLLGLFVLGLNVLSIAFSMGSDEIKEVSARGFGSDVFLFDPIKILGLEPHDIPVSCDLAGLF